MYFSGAIKQLCLQTRAAEGPLRQNQSLQCVHWSSRQCQSVPAAPPSSCTWAGTTGRTKTKISKSQQPSCRDGRSRMSNRDREAQPHLIETCGRGRKPCPLGESNTESRVQSTKTFQKKKRAQDITQISVWESHNEREREKGDPKPSKGRRCFAVTK